MKYKLIPLHELKDEGSGEHGVQLAENERNLNLLASKGWRVVAVVDGHILVLELDP